MKFGVNLLLFGDTIDAAMLDRFAVIRDHGFDGVELPVFNPGAIVPGPILRRARECGLALTISGALPNDAAMYGPDAAAHQRADRYLRDLLDLAQRLESSVICGPLCKPVGCNDQSVRLEEQRRQAAERLAPRAAEAHRAGIVLALEPLNRFETNLINTAAQGCAFCAAAGGGGVGLLLDTFHMHIEEKDTAQAITQTAEAGCLAHFHASENDRGVAGTGQVDWASAASALRHARYDGWVVLESFNQANQAIRTAVSCWRPFYPSEDVFLRDGLRFVKTTFAPQRSA